MSKVLVRGIISNTLRFIYAEDVGYLGKNTYLMSFLEYDSKDYNVINGRDYELVVDKQRKNLPQLSFKSGELVNDT